VIREINNNEEDYFTNAAGQRIEVKVVDDHDPPYLTTHPDDITKNNLLELPSC